LKKHVLGPGRRPLAYNTFRPVVKGFELRSSLGRQFRIDYLHLLWVYVPEEIGQLFVDNWGTNAPPRRKHSVPEFRCEIEHPERELAKRRRTPGLELRAQQAGHMARLYLLRRTTVLGPDFF
jgi:hypothetical protein